ncbi:MAG TPA: DUF899 family protein [Geminicoccaceae bacterium]|jgi:predicted dithiol-disulfide oxidoreductase (DUF899 family)|nr:DUF899 family protein [Geminicoccaceae bacterium]
MTGTREEWLAVRLELLQAEKELTRRSEELARRRQELPCAQLAALAPLIGWTSQMAGFWPSRFDHLEDLLKRMDQ